MLSSLFRIVFLFCLLYAPALLAQPWQSYLPSPTQNMDTLSLYAKLSFRRDLSISQSPYDYQEEAKEVFHERHEQLIESVKAGKFIFHEDLQFYLDSLFKELTLVNDLGLDPLVLVRRSYVPNARSMGEGIFIINIGLLQQIRTEEELAYIFCHELAHDHLHHHAQNLEHRHALNALESESWRTRRKRKKHGIPAEEEFKNILYRMGKKSRTSELAADSLALIFLDRTPYPRSAAQQALIRLHGFKFPELSGLNLKLFFQLDSFSFQDHWIEEEKKMFGGSFGNSKDADEFSIFNPDSLDSHPALGERLQSIEALLKVGNIQGHPIKNPWQEVADYMIIESFLDQGFTVHALLSILESLEKEPENTYLHAQLGQSLLATYQAIGNHKFNLAVPPTNYFDDPTATQLIRMLRKMRPHEIVELAYYYLQEKSEQFPDDPLIRTQWQNVKDILEKINKKN